MSRYEPLSRYLESRREAEAPLNFSEVEAILGRDLPYSARHHQPWWANTTTHSHAESWLRVGWKTRAVDLARQRVVFVRARDEKPPARSAPLASQRPAGPKVELHDLSVAAAKLLADYTSEADGDVGAAVGRALHEAAIARRVRLIDSIRANAPTVADNSTDIIRADRDAR
ncbi:MAG TPA: hypothetical protein VHY32_11180 [Caulobacteraceae bacterium]|nr:hypothetical protein [Caulobacteraceae bacterium]